jgi:N-acylneuraminate cytidylyltransferase
MERVGGLTLVERAVNCALACEELNIIYVSSDCPKVLTHIDRSSGRVFPHERAPKMAKADSPIEPLLQLVMGYVPEATHLVLLNPTSPFRSPWTVEKCINVARQRPELSTVATVVERNWHHYAWQWDQDANCWRHPWRGEQRPRSQDLPGVMVEHGACYVFSRSIIEQGRLFGSKAWAIETDATEAIDIDYPLDLAMARGVAQWLGE